MLIEVAWCNWPALTPATKRAHQNGQPVPEDFKKFTNENYLNITQGLKALAKRDGYRAVWLMGNRPQSWRIH